MAYVAGLVRAERVERVKVPERPERPGAGSGEEPAELTSLVRRWLTTARSVAGSGTEPATDATALPRREDRPVPPSRRLGVLVDASTTPATHADALMDLLGDAGRITVLRAYADWTVPTSQAWRSRLRSLGIHPQHHFSSQGGQRAMVAMTVDAVDLAREAAVDAVAVVGDLRSAHPLVARLNASGLAVLGVGPTDTPYDVRALCEEFVDLAFLDAHRSSGRHRA